MKENIKLLGFLSYSFLLLAGILLIFANLYDEPYAGIACAVILTVSMILFCMDQFFNRIGLAIFIACVFTFQIAGIAIPAMIGDPEWSLGLSDHEYVVTCNCIYLSCLVILLATIFLEKHKFVWGNFHGAKLRLLQDSAYNITAVQKWAFRIFMISTVIAIVGEAQQMIYAIANGYMSMYGDYTSSALFSRMEIVSRTAMFIGLAANPSKKRARIYFALGIPVPIMKLIEGSRTWIMMYILFYIYYFYLFDNWNKTEVSFKEKKKKNRRLITIIIIMIVIVAPMLYIYGYSRVDRSMDGSTNPIMLILQFFASQGASARLIGWAERYKGSLPGICYSLGSIIDRIQGNSYPAYSVESALNMNRFGNIMTYLDSPYNYTVFHYGVGSSYIAEVYYDFGYIGLIIVNIILSCMLNRLSSYKNINIISKNFAFMFLFYIMMIPRGSLLTPVDNIISVSCLLTVLMVFFLSGKKGYYGKEKNSPVYTRLFNGRR